MSQNKTQFRIATRGSALALAQANVVLNLCCKEFPEFSFEIKVFKTTGDSLQNHADAEQVTGLSKGLFIKELETALHRGEADLAVHSLKDLPTALPEGLTLGSVGCREDVADVLIYRDATRIEPDENSSSKEEWSPGQARKSFFKPGASISDLPSGLVVATNSNRRSAQIRNLRPDFKVIPIRGNVGTRLRKLRENPEMDLTILAAAGMNRLNIRLMSDGRLKGTADCEHLTATRMQPDEMLPCVGQGAVGIEIRENDESCRIICDKLNHANTWKCVSAERAFLEQMGGGCQSPVAAYARIVGHQIHLKAISFLNDTVQEGESYGDPDNPVDLGIRLALDLGKPKVEE